MLQCPHFQAGRLPFVCLEPTFPITWHVEMKLFGLKDRDTNQRLSIYRSILTCSFNVEYGPAICRGFLYHKKLPHINQDKSHVVLPMYSHYNPMKISIGIPLLSHETTSGGVVDEFGLQAPHPGYRDLAGWPWAPETWGVLRPKGPFQGGKIGKSSLF